MFGDIFYHYFWKLFTNILCIVHKPSWLSKNSKQWRNLQLAHIGRRKCKLSCEGYFLRERAELLWECSGNFQVECLGSTSEGMSGSPCNNTNLYVHSIRVVNEKEPKRRAPKVQETRLQRRRGAWGLGSGYPLPSGWEVWGGAISAPRNFFIFLSHNGAF